MSGIERGLQLLADWMKLLLLAAARSNTGALHDALDVAKVWLGETVNDKGQVRINAFDLLLPGADPWKQSRKAFQTIDAKWRGKL